MLDVIPGPNDKKMGDKKIEEKEICAIVVAAGRGNRFGHTTPKQYEEIDGQYIIRKAISPFVHHPDIGHVQVVIHPDDQAIYEHATRDMPLPPPVYGAKERQGSVYAGLKALEPYNPKYVLIHDAARPFISTSLIQKIIDSLDSASGAVPALPMTDTLKEGQNGFIEKTLNRNHVWAAQTPQGFHFQNLLAAHTMYAGQDAFDDAHIMERAGYGPIALINGDIENRKVTYSSDISLAETSQERSTSQETHLSETRTGIGFDVHAFCEGDSITLCGIKIPYTKSLNGHSDADVALHALCDALYGSIGASDIGEHFPPSDSHWKNAPSQIFVDHAQGMIRKKKGRITNVDITIICEDPKIGPYRSEMREAVASQLGLDVTRVNIKATTTEKRGALGRKEGIAAQAIATITLPYSMTKL